MPPGDDFACEMPETGDAGHAPVRDAGADTGPSPAQPKALRDQSVTNRQKNYFIAMILLEFPELSHFPERGRVGVGVSDEFGVIKCQKWNMIIDVAECTNCQLCALSAMDEYVGNEWPGVSAPMPRNGHRWIDILQKERGQVPMIDIAYVPTMCNHCDNAPCLAKGGDAVKKRDDGIVIIDPVKAKGRKDLVESCPYGHIWWNEEAQLPQIWPFDAHLLDQGWKQTRAQQACPTGAIKRSRSTTRR